MGYEAENTYFHFILEENAAVNMKSYFLRYWQKKQSKEKTKPNSGPIVFELY